MASFNECPLCSSFEMKSSNIKLIYIHVYMLDSHSTKILKSNMIYDDRIINYLSFMFEVRYIDLYKEVHISDVFSN